MVVPQIVSIYTFMKVCSTEFWPRTRMKGITPIFLTRIYLHSSKDKFKISSPTSQIRKRYDRPCHTL